MFRKGESGNPGGRAKGSAELRDLARQHAPDAVERLVRIMRDGDDRVAATAAGLLLDRGYGRPAAFGDGEPVVVIREFTGRHGVDHRTDLDGRPVQ